MTGPRFAVLIFPDAPVDELNARMTSAEALGFDQLVVPEHIGDFRNPAGTWHESWTVLAAAATVTRRIRLGTLVANPMLRPPAVLARHAITLDHLSGGRLDLGLGAGIFAFDHHATGTRPWTPRERAGRFDDYTRIVDGVLRGAGAPFSFHGRHLSAQQVPTAPAPLQRPRPPITFGGQSPTILRLAAERAEAWNTHGPPGAGLDDLVGLTARQNRHLDELCARGGRDPATLRRALTLFGAADPWSAPVTVPEIVERFTPAGIQDFVLHWPPAHRRPEIATLAREVLPTLR